MEIIDCGLCEKLHLVIIFIYCVTREEVGSLSRDTWWKGWVKKVDVIIYGNIVPFLMDDDYFRCSVNTMHLQQLASITYVSSRSAAAGYRSYISARTFLIDDIRSFWRLYEIYCLKRYVIYLECQTYYCSR